MASSSEPGMQILTMPQLTWLDHLHSLLPFFRYTLIWVDIVLTSLSPFSSIGAAGGLSGVTGLALVFNVGVCAIQQKQRYHKLPSEEYIPQSVYIICGDLLLCAGYIVIWVFEMLQNYGYGWQYGHQYTRIFWAYTMVGSLVAWHYHLFFAGISLYIWILQRKAPSGKIVLQ